MGNSRRPVAVAVVPLLLAVLAVFGCSDGAPLTAPGDRPAEGADASSTVDVTTVVSLGGLGGASTVATAVNESHQVVGTAETSSGHQHAFLWSDGAMRDLGTLGGSWSTAADVNEWGQVAGTSVTGGGEARAFFWADGTMYQLGTLGGRESHGVAVNDRGEVAGYSTTADGEVHAFLWSKGRMHDLGTLGGRGSYTAAANSRGDVVGQSVTERGETHAFLWSGGRLSGLTPDQARSSDAVDVSEAGHVLVNSRAGRLGRVHLWSDGMIRELDPVEEGSAVAADVNARGHVVGQITSSSRGTRAVLWRDGRPLALHPTSLSQSSTATAINDSEVVTGSIRLSEASGQRAFLWSAAGLHVLRPDALDDVPENTAGVDVTTNGVVLGLASYSSGDTRSFLWFHSAGSAPESVESDRRTSDRFDDAVARPLSKVVDATAARGHVRDSPLADETALGRAMDQLTARHPELAWPRSVEALRTE